MKRQVIFSEKTDSHASLVAKRIRDRGGNCTILDTADYPEGWSISIEITKHLANRYLIKTADVEIDGEHVTGVWWRRPNQPVPAAGILNPRHSRFAANEARSLLLGFLTSLGNKVINPIASEESLKHKVYQLDRAAAAGFNIPRTLISNDPDQVRQFYMSNKAGGTIFKILTNIENEFLPTRVMTDEHLSIIDFVKHSPVIFQERVEKIADIRVAVIDSEIHAVSCQPNHEEAKIDWRLDPSTRYVPHALPIHMKEMIDRFMKATNLRFGAFDFCLTEPDVYTFLEINVSGQFIFAEVHAGQPVSDAMARSLMGVGHRD
ncbi:MAG: hypothetical protein KGM42_18610 [Hyphomicrobiales bacterium]|nr:hypothetical protein [Hyphomicrobiales bacterium]